MEKETFANIVFYKRTSESGIFLSKDLSQYKTKIFVDIFYESYEFVVEVENRLGDNIVFKNTFPHPDRDKAEAEFMMWLNDISNFLEDKAYEMASMRNDFYFAKQKS